MSYNVGNGLTVVNAKTRERIACNVFAMAKDPDGNDLNATFATMVPGTTPPEFALPNVDPGFAFFVTAKGPGRLAFIKQGYTSRLVLVNFPIDTNREFELEPEAGSSPQPVPSSALHLEVRGHDFVDANGKPTCYSCIDRFNVPRMWMDKRFAEIDALIDEQLKLDMNWSRMLFMGHESQNTIFSLSPDEPGFDQMVIELTDHCNQRGVGILGEVFADNQVVGQPMSHFRRMTDLWQGKIVIASGGNEWPKNGFDPQALQLPGGGMVCSRGSSLADELTPQNGATCASFHQRTDSPTMQRDTVASAVEMMIQGYTVIMCDEPTRFNFDGSNKSNVPDSPRLALMLAAVYSAYWDLADFHHQAGQRGMLMDATGLAIAEQWQRGMNL